PLHGDLKRDALLDGVATARDLLRREVDDLGVDHLGLLGAVEELYVVGEPALVEEHVAAVGALLVDLALIDDLDAQALVEEGHLLETGAQRLVVELDGLEDVAVRPEGDRGARGLRRLALGERRIRNPVVERHRPVRAVALHVDVESVRQGVDHRAADAMQATGDRVSAATELAAGVQDREHDLDRGLLLDRVLGDRDAAAVVDDAHTAVGEDRDLDVVAVAGEGLIDGVVDDLVDQVVQTTWAGRSDVHSRALADRFEPLENLDGFGAVAVGRGTRRGGIHRGRAP